MFPFSILELGAVGMLTDGQGESVLGQKEPPFHWDKMQGQHHTSPLEKQLPLVHSAYDTPGSGPSIFCHWLVPVTLQELAWFCRELSGTLEKLSNFLRIRKWWCYWTKVAWLQTSGSSERPPVPTAVLWAFPRWLPNTVQQACFTYFTGGQKGPAGPQAGKTSWLNEDLPELP